MIWGKSNSDEKLKALLKKSGSDFQFDPNQVKYRLLTSIGQVDQKPRPHFRISRVAKYSVGFVGTVAFLSTTLAVASNSKPGDQLFALNKLGEQVILKLPLSVEQKANVEAYIVTNRLQALDQVKAKPSKTITVNEAKNLITVKETDESFSSAINEISLNKQALEAQGNSKAADKLEILLDKLQAQAEQREAAIKALEEETTSDTVKAKIKIHLAQLKSSRQKARLQIRRFQDTITKPPIRMMPSTIEHTNTDNQKPD